ncbi:MAG TPA: SUMF1/EgtB/PvdO family nonheme iron enzyme [Solirubrobacteraceae bacterium]|nr:SUMF1/EgtB/PvdO family nonheme iron enzyme [Solirubrobacteraceae bacterium]
MVGVAEDLHLARKRTLDLVRDLTDDELHTPVDPVMSPLVWDLAHIAAYEDLWAVHRLGGEPLLRPELAAVYDAFETPRPVRAEIELLDRAGTLRYLAEVRARTLAVFERTGPSELHELVLRHELQHTETMRQAMALGGLLADGEPALDDQDGGDLETIEIPPGPFVIGAGDDGFAYDNERPAHEVELAGFRIGRRPITNATWLRFAEGGGYERREWWSDEGWAWKEEYDIHAHAGCVAGSPALPVVCLSWFEAGAFARSLGCRLPTEAEWERASASVQGLGQVWEWTATEFSGYPGFVAHPYREYSEVFFDRGYYVLRGGSWATAPRVATRTFRNWDLPQRRQIFSGIRIVEAA